jgi:hypothetical protein
MTEEQNGAKNNGSKSIRSSMATSTAPMMADFYRRVAQILH